MSEGVVEAVAESVPVVEKTSSFHDLHFLDDGDSANMLNAFTPTHLDNLVQGGSTWGFYDMIKYCDEVFTDQWLYIANDLGMGMGAGLIISAVGVRLVFMPLMMYSQISGIKMKLLQPDMEQLQESAKRYMKTGNREAAKIEQAKVKKLRSKYGIFPSISTLNILQMPMHLTWISLVNKMAFNYPGLLTDGGFLWFKDLSSPDPLGVLPVIGASVTFMNIMSTSTTNLNPTMRNLRRYMFILPLMTIPVWMTFPAAFNIYWLSVSSLQLIVLNLFRNFKFRSYMGIPQFLPGTKLERMNLY